MIDSTHTIRSVFPSYFLLALCVSSDGRAAVSLWLNYSGFFWIYIQFFFSYLIMMDKLPTYIGCENVFFLFFFPFKIDEFVMMENWHGKNSWHDYRIFLDNLRISNWCYWLPWSVWKLGAPWRDFWNNQSNWEVLKN